MWWVCPFGVPLLSIILYKYYVLFVSRCDLADVDGQKLSLFGYIEKNNKRLGITWESVCEALDGYEGNLAFQLREKYCNKGVCILCTS